MSQGKTSLPKSPSPLRSEGDLGSEVCLSGKSSLKLLKSQLFISSLGQALIYAVKQREQLLLGCSRCGLHFVLADHYLS